MPTQRISPQHVNRDREVLWTIQHSEGLTEEDLNAIKVELAGRYGTGSFVDRGRATTVPAHTCRFFSTNGSWVVVPSDRKDLEHIWRRVQWSSRFAGTEPAIAAAYDWTDSMPPWYEVARHGRGDVLNLLTGEQALTLAERLTDFQGGPLMRGGIKQPSVTEDIEFVGAALLYINLTLDEIGQWGRQLTGSDKEQRFKDVRLLRTKLSGMLSGYTPVCRGAPQDGRLENYIANVNNGGAYNIIGLTDQGWKRPLLEVRFKEHADVEDASIDELKQYEYSPGILHRGIVQQWQTFVTKTLYGPPHIALGAALQSVVYRNPRAEDMVRAHLEGVYGRFTETGDWQFADGNLATRHASAETRGLWDARVAKALLNLGRLQVSATEEIDRLGSRNAQNDSTTFINQILG